MAIGEKIMSFLSGGLGEGIVKIIDQRVADRDLAAKLKHDLAVLQENNQHEAEILAMQIENDLQQSHDRRVEEELRQNDTYTKRTRPRIARQSWYAGCGYIAVHLLTTVLSPFIAWTQYDLATDLLQVRQLQPIPLDWGMLVAVYSPALAYMGVRSFDKWGRPSADRIMSG